MSYHLTYRLDAHPEGLTREQVETLRAKDDLGACDTAVLLATIEADDGSSSTIVLTRDGRTGEPLDDGAAFKAWAILAGQLSESPSLGGPRRAIARAAFETVREAVLSARKSPS